MDYTQAPDHDTDTATGHRLHTDTAAVPTELTAQDINMLIWSLMEFLNAAGVTPRQFDKTNPATYQALHAALNKLYLSAATGTWANSVDGINRLYFADEAETYLRGAGGTPIFFRNGSNGDLGHFISDGRLSIAADALNPDEVVRLGQMTGRLLNVRLFTRANNGQAYVPTAGTKAVLAFAQAAGGSSSGLPATGGGQWTTAQGAASGACAVGYYTAGFSGVTMTIGQSVAPGVGSAGITGGSTSFGSLLSATGGAGSGVPLVVANSITTLSGPVDALTTTAGALWSFFGQAGGQVTGLAGSQSVSGNGGSSYFGVGGTGRNIDTSPLVHYDGLSGQGFGQGAGGGVSGGSCTATVGAKGGDGCIVVYEFS